MSEADKEKWDAKYRSATHPSFAPSKVLESVVDYLPSTGSAIDLAGGVGRHSIWLAQRGLDVTLADVSPVALAIASDEAKAKGVPISMLEIDLESQSFPAGPWDVVLSVLYLNRALWVSAAENLSIGGILIVLQPTINNLQRHPKPPRRFLLEERELCGLACGLEIIDYREGWLEDGRHDALLVGRKPRSDISNPVFDVG